jgi:transposase, IS5 family
MMRTPPKKRAPAPVYVSPNQLTLEGFATPFSQNLSVKNRWVQLSHLIPWDEVSSLYLKHVKIHQTGRPPLNPRIVLGALIIKHLLNLDDRETVCQITENMYMQYFLGYSSFTTEAPFDASLFVEFRKRLGMEALNELNERIMQLKIKMETSKREPEQGIDSNDSNEQNQITSDKVSGTNQKPDSIDNSEQKEIITNKGRLLLDATACPQDIAYPTDLTLLSDARQKAEELIDILYDADLHKKKPRTYREIARKRYLRTAQKKNKMRKEIRRAVGSQLRFLKRNLKSINKLLDKYKTIPLSYKDHRYLLVIGTLYQQQKEMFDQRKHSVDDRIVSIHQPHVRPIVRGKSQAKVEFGSKINVSLVDGISFLDKLSWDAFNEGSYMMEYIEKYRKRFGFYPAEILADKIYCTRENRRLLKELSIKLIAKPLGRPSAVKEHVRPGERNPIEGKFGQAKTAYGLDRIRARLKNTSQSWIASIILVLNLVKLAGSATLYNILKIVRWSFSAPLEKKLVRPIHLKIGLGFFSSAKLLKSQPVKLNWFA